MNLPKSNKNKYKERSSAFNKCLKKTTEIKKKKKKNATN